MPNQHSLEPKSTGEVVIFTLHENEHEHILWPLKVVVTIEFVTRDNG